MEVLLLLVTMTPGSWQWGCTRAIPQFIRFRLCNLLVFVSVSLFDMHYVPFNTLGIE